MGTAQFFAADINSARTPEAHLAESSFIFHPDNEKSFRLTIQHGLELICDRLRNTDAPFSGISPKELAAKFESVNLEMPHDSLHQTLEELHTLYLKDAVYFHHPRYLAHLNCPIVYPAILAELILSSINSSLDTWDQSAGGTLIEQSLIDWTCDKVGYEKKLGDGVFTSGGTQSNLMALLLARDNYFNQQGYSIRESGLPEGGSKFCILTSEVSHFSIQKSAALLGLGYDSVLPIKCDANYRMDIEALRSCLKNCKAGGKIPLAIVATAGTTDFGSIDPISQIVEVCREQKIWLHVDAAYGCGLLVSRQHRAKLEGIELADSVTVDYHKSFFQPVSCGAFLVRDNQHLSLITHHAEYLNPLCQSQEGTPNLVNKSLQTTRRFDALKLWLTLRMMGPQLLGDYFDRLLSLASRVHQKLLLDSEIEVLNTPELSALVFRFLPNVGGEKANAINFCELNQNVRKSLSQAGAAVIAGTKVNELSYLKFTLLNPQTKTQEVLEVVELIKSHGRKILTDSDQTKSRSTVQVSN
ncbi:MAG: aspartate aminotransferase family protein [Kangiellaceae bacterium]|nr:aspartate aminotransferase family protein [Kangiellaceae bacterium]MCW9017182.1 aspartate aminotransferase family protein [Kangiellaceae bacterium]